MPEPIDIAGLDPARVIQALYADARPLGMGFLQYEDGELPYDEAAALVGRHIDYLKGRVMKVRIAGDSFEPWLYDRDNGPGAAARAVESLRNRAGVVAS